MSSLRRWLVFTTLLHGCATDDPELVDGSFLDDGKPDGVSGVEVHSYEADAIVSFLDAAPAGVLADDVDLGRRVADAIVMARSARPFATLFDVDRVRYTEQTFFDKTRAWVRAHETLGRCGDGIVQPSVETCDGGADCSGCRLANGVELGRFEHGRWVLDSVPLSGGGVALLTRESPGSLGVSQLSVAGDVVAQTWLGTMIDGDARLTRGLDGALAVSFVGTSVVVDGRSYRCPAADGRCGFVFTLEPDGRVDAGRDVGDFANRAPQVVALASGDWAVGIDEAYQTTLTLLDRATLATVWAATVATRAPTVGPYLDSGKVCTLVRGGRWDDTSAAERCRTEAGDDLPAVPVDVFGAKTVVAGRTGVLAIFADSVRAVTPGIQAPAMIPFATMPWTRVQPLDGGRLLVASEQDIALIDAAGRVAWQHPVVAHGLALGDGVVAVRTATATLLLEP